MKEITDEYMKEMLTKSTDYAAVILKKSNTYGQPGTDKIVWEHGRRNFALRAEGILSIVCPVRDDSEISGVGIFNGTVEEIRKVMDEDPGVKAGVFTYEIYACRGFPGDCLPERPRRPDYQRPDQQRPDQQRPDQQRPDQQRPDQQRPD